MRPCPASRPGGFANWQFSSGETEIVGKLAIVAEGTYAQGGGGPTTAKS